MFPKIKVNKKSCSIEIYGFKKLARVTKAQSLLEAAKMLNKYLTAADAIFAKFADWNRKLGFQILQTYNVSCGQKLV